VDDTTADSWKGAFLMTSLMVYGKYVVVDANTVIPSGAVYIEGDTIVQVGTYGDITNGEILVKDGIPTRFDRQEILRKLKESIPADYATTFREGNRLFPALREKIASYFDPWHKALESSTKTPYYLLNNRK
jgi:hypothetical protein